MAAPPQRVSSKTSRIGSSAGYTAPESAPCPAGADRKGRSGGARLRPFAGVIAAKVSGDDGASRPIGRSTPARLLVRVDPHGELGAQLVRATVGPSGRIREWLERGAEGRHAHEAQSPERLERNCVPIPTFPHRNIAGLISSATSEMRSTGMPARRACSRSASGFGASYSQ